MYSRFTLIIATVLVLISGPVVRAEDPSSLMLTDDQISVIRANCIGVQSTLQRIHSSDALAYYNLVQQYYIISVKLMAPMNGRVALNKLDGVAMTQTTVDFDDQVDNFRSMYQQYEETMQRALSMNCKDQPVSFFDTLNLARDHRVAVREAVDKATALINQYESQFNTMRAAALKQATVTGTGR
jgi:hypothetical protein